MDDRAAELADALECRRQIGDGEVGQGGGVAGARSALVDSEAQVVGVGLPPGSGRGGPWCEGDPEDSVPEPAGAIRILGRELDQWCGHGWSMAGARTRYSAARRATGRPLPALILRRPGMRGRPDARPLQASTRSYRRGERWSSNAEPRLGRASTLGQAASPLYHPSVARRDISGPCYAPATLVVPPWYRMHLLCVRGVHRRGRWGRRGRVRTYRARVFVGWGPSGRWFKSSRPD